MIGLFNTDIKISGKHAEYIRALSKGANHNSGGVNPNEVSRVFQSTYEIILLAPIIGFLANRISPVDKDDSIRDSTIFASQLINVADQLEMTYRMIMLLYTHDGVSQEERINRAFKYDRDDEHRKVGDDIFWGYVRGGIEKLYEDLAEGVTDDDMLVQKLFESVNMFEVTVINKDDVDCIYRLCQEASV